MVPWKRIFLMRFLVTNDDGVYSPGLLALAEVASKFGEVQIVAPDIEQSSMGHAVTHSRPLTYRKTPRVPFEARRVNGTPADCVALGCHHRGEIDVVLSGINLGLNLGNSMWHSGTLAAAKQAALFGIPGIAFSAPIDKLGEPNFEKIAPFVEQVLTILLDGPRLMLVNVNFPDSPQGIRWTQQSVRHYDGKIVAGADPLGREHFWFTVIPLEPSEEGTDRWAVEQGFVSMTPLTLDLTSHAELAEVQQRHPLP